MGIPQPVRPAACQRCFKFCQHVEASPCGFGRFVLEGVPGTHPAKTAAQGFYGVRPWQASGRAKAVEGAARALGRGGV